MYNKASDINYINKLPQSSYFTTRLNEAQLALEREEAAEKAARKVEQQTRERHICMFLRKFSPEVVADAFERPLDQVQYIAEKYKIKC